MNSDLGELEDNFFEIGFEIERKVKVRNFRNENDVVWGGEVIKRGLEDDDVEYAFYIDNEESFDFQRERIGCSGLLDCGSIGIW